MVPQIHRLESVPHKRAHATRGSFDVQAASSLPLLMKCSGVVVVRIGSTPANDAYVRDFKLFVPSDCVVSLTEEENSYALKLMEKVLKADISASTDLDLKAIRSPSEACPP